MEKHYPKVYEKHKDWYEVFSQAEDAPQKIRKFITHAFDLENKIILDLGCGSGKFIPFFAPRAKRYYALDASKKLLEIAGKKCTGMKNISFIHSLAQKIPLPNNSVDVVFSSWALSAMNFIDKREKALKEIFRVLKKGGECILVENNFKGNLQRVFGYNPNPYEFNYQYWLKENGFKIVKRIKTYFLFKSLADAKSSMSAIFRNQVSSRIVDKKVIHEVVILHKRKAIKTNHHFQ